MQETLRALGMIRRELGLQTVLGVSNVSFGLPNRPFLNQTFLSQALAAGLTLPILNPNLPEMMDTIAAHRVLSGEDVKCSAYVSRFAQQLAARAASAESSLTLEEAIVRGLRGEASKLAKAAVQTEAALSIVENRLIPALDQVGADYES